VSVEHVDDGAAGRRSHVAVRDLLLAAVCGSVFGIFYVALHHTSDASGFWPLLAVSVSMVITMVVRAVLVRNVSMLRFDTRVFLACAPGGLLEALAATLYVVATRQGLLSVTAGISSLYPVGTALLAGYLLKERLTMVNVVGLVLCAGGLAFLAF
jgi:uncharacterized membrane protein